MSCRETRRICLLGEELELVVIQAGRFWMGSGNRVFDEGPWHEVEIGRAFLLGTYPVTQRQWTAVMRANPSGFAGELDHPVENVSWDDASEFCERVSVATGHEARLPSEAEWEFACRAGTTADYFVADWETFADDTAVTREAALALCDYAWFDINSNEHTQPVGRKRPNPWGLHDMIGNVWEWCADVWHASYEHAPTDGSPRRDGFERQPRRCLRGGAWDMNAFRCRSPYRSFDHRSLATNRFGLRLAMDAW